MSKDSKKTPIAAGPDAKCQLEREPPVMNNNTGRVRHDDRGNAIWEWAAKLDNGTLSLADDAPINAGLHKNPLGTVKGYSPYDSGLLARKAAARRKDLRRLSEWLKLKKLAENRKADDE